MPRQCAFCPSKAKLTGEHFWSDWMNELFPGGKRFTMRDKSGKFTKEWRTGSLDWTARVVCEPCNGGWMSGIENLHAKPTMTDLILGNGTVEIPQTAARSIALFAFKTTVIFDCMQGMRNPFFTRRTRYRFRESLEIPSTVNMWMAAYIPRGTGAVITGYGEGSHRLAGHIELYTCTYAVGHFVFQVCAERRAIRVSLVPKSGFEYLAIPFWPKVPADAIWPPSFALESAQHFQEFSLRWNEVEPRRFTG